MQKASIGKRIIASISDGILVSIIAVGLAALLTIVLNTDKHITYVENAYAKYEAEYDNLTDEKREVFDKAIEALNNDSEAKYHYNMWMQLTLLTITFSVLMGVVLIEFVVPLVLGNGQTIGKKIFGIALMHQEGIKIKNSIFF